MSATWPARATLAASLVGVVEAGVQVEAAVEAPAVHGAGLHAARGVQALVHQREQLLHVPLVRRLREHLAQRADVPRALRLVAVRHVACAHTTNMSQSTNPYGRVVGDIGEERFFILYSSNGFRTDRYN